MNKTSANEWLKKAYHDLKSAQILYITKHLLVLKSLLLDEKVSIKSLEWEK